MLKKFWKSMRVVLPPRWALGVLVFALFLTVLQEVALWSWVSWSLFDNFNEIPWPTQYSSVLPLGLFFYAIWRGIAFHPAWRNSYRHWLERTPWQAPKPLPFGPAHLVWQDMLIFAIVTVAWTLPEDRLFVPLAFLIPYCVLLTVANFRTGVDWAGFGGLAVMTSLLLVFGEGLPMLVLMLIAYVICCFGLQSSLRNFPWDDSHRFQSFKLVTSNQQRQKNVLWPMVHDEEYGTLRPWMPWKTVWALSVLVGWLAFCMAHCYVSHAAPRDVRDFHSELPGILSVAALMCCCGRLGAYCFKHGWPISFWGRLRTVRWIIPGFDRVLVAPLAALALGYFLPRWLVAWAVPLPVVAMLSTFAIAMITLGVGPSLSDWHLTGKHRLLVYRPSPKWVQL